MNNALLVMMIGEGAAASIAVFADDFNRADGALSSPWVNGPGATSVINIASNVAVGTNSEGNDNLAIVGTPTFAANQKATAKIAALVSGHDPCVAVRGNISNGSCYFFGYGVAGGQFVAYMITDTGSLGYTAMGNTGSISVSVGDTFSLEVVTNGGTSDFIGRHNGSQVLTFSDSTIASGQPGIRIWNSASGVDDFSATDI